MSLNKTAMNLVIFTVLLFTVSAVLGHAIIREIANFDQRQDRHEIRSIASQKPEQQEKSEDQKATEVFGSRDAAKSKEEGTTVEERQEEEQEQEDSEVTTSRTRDDPSEDVETQDSEPKISVNPRCSAIPQNHEVLKQTSENLYQVLRDFSESLVSQVADRVRDQKVKDLQAMLSV